MEKGVIWIQRSFRYLYYLRGERREWLILDITKLDLCGKNLRVAHNRIKIENVYFDTNWEGQKRNK